MYDILKNLLNESNYEEAEKELQKCLLTIKEDAEEDDVLAILAT